MCVWLKCFYVSVCVSVVCVTVNGRRAYTHYSKTRTHTSTPHQAQFVHMVFLVLLVYLVCVFVHLGCVYLCRLCRHIHIDETVSVAHLSVE